MGGGGVGEGGSDKASMRYQYYGITQIARRISGSSYTPPCTFYYSEITSGVFHFYYILSSIQAIR